MWQPLIAREALREGEMQEIERAERRVVVALNGGKPYAFNALCPHASAELAGGDLRPTYVICPLHNYRYDLASGRCLKPKDGPRLKVYRVEWRDDVLWGDL